MTPTLTAAEKLEHSVEHAWKSGKQYVTLDLDEATSLLAALAEARSEVERLRKEVDEQRASRFAEYEEAAKARARAAKLSDALDRFYSYTFVADEHGFRIPIHVWDELSKAYLAADDKEQG